MYRKILVTLDGSSIAAQALPHAEAIGTRFGSEIVLMQVITFSNIGAVSLDTQVPLDFPVVEHQLRDQAMEYLEREAERFRGQGLTVTLKVERGSAAKLIVDKIDEEKIDLVILTSHGRSGFSKWLHGSVAEKVMQHAACPVLLIRTAQPG